MYTDGSQGSIRNSKQNAVAVCQVGYSNSQLRLRKGQHWNLGSQIEVADAEVFAISKALQLATKMTKSRAITVYVFVDS